MTREFVSILDKRFQYTPSSKTDIRKLFEKVRKEQQKLTRQKSGPR